MTYYVVGHFHYVLSMGALFSLIGGYFYWSETMFGLKYNKVDAVILFWLLFNAVNGIFLPMHFLGANGMPRRICDYPDSFVPWNKISSIFSSISIIALILSLKIVYDQLINGQEADSKNMRNSIGNYNAPDFMMSNYSNVNYSDIELILPRPADYHTFNELPILYAKPVINN